MTYEKRIRYIDYWDNGRRIRSVGFVKIEIKNDSCNIQMRVDGVPVAENSWREVKACAIEMGESIQGIMGKMEFAEGSGYLNLKRIPVDSLCENISYRQLTEIRIVLGKNRELICRWRDAAQDIRESVQAAWQEPEQALPQEPTQVVSQESTQAASRESMQVSPHEVQPSEQAREAQQTTQLESRCKMDPQSQSVPAMPHSLQEDKWRQLEAIYPHIAHFHDKRDYLTIGPQDFVILPKQYYQLITNSFLLHGYYNYGHMVLAREVQNGEEKFFIGVPGNFYEKERQAAIMFGFESFECKKEPVQTGDYGYFMIRVEL